MDNMNEIRPKRKWYWIGSAMMVIPAVLYLIFFGGIIYLAMGQTTSLFVAPGELTIQVEKPGTYVVWSIPQGTVDGQFYSAPKELPPGLGISVYDSTGSRLSLGSSQATSMRGSGSSHDDGRRQITSFEAPAPGSYRIVIEGEFPDRVCGVNRSAFQSAGSAFGLLGGILAVNCLSPILFLGGLTIVIVTLVRRIIAKRAAAPPMVA